MVSLQLPSEEPLYENFVNFINDDHIQAFATALDWEHLIDDETTATATTNGYNILTSSLQSPHSDAINNLPNSPDEQPPNNTHSLVHTINSLSPPDPAGAVAAGASPPPRYTSQAFDPADTIDPSTVSMIPVKPKPDLITSKSDWYPINNTVASSSSSASYRKNLRKSKKKLNGKSTSSSSAGGSLLLRNEFRSSITYHMLRWPILIFVLSWITFLCNGYILVRAYVALSEYFFTWVGKRKRIRDKLRRSKNYEEWVKTAQELDRFLNLDKWSTNPKFSYYDYRTVRLTIGRLAGFRELADDDNLLVLLQGCLKKNFAGIENRQLYSHRYYGTKTLVSDYIDEVVKCVEHVTNSPKISLIDKLKFFKIVLKNYGKSALCLSGGACFAYTHFGIVKALLDNDLLPSIISGTSGGGIVAALACTRTDAELKKLLTPKLASKITACEEPWYVWLPRWWKTGARFDSVDWAKKANFFTRGSMTFLESYQRTGRKLNISTVPADPHSPVILCNSITSPNCIIWSSLLASSAVPGILNPVVLMMKNPHNNEVVPFSLGNKWRDGSLRTDIPLDALNTYYNVNFSIVSQVNPHISLFFFAPKGTVGRPVATARRFTRKEKYASLRGGFVATALEQLFKLEITKWLQMIKTLDLLPHFLEQDWLNIWLQRFSGSITIWPKIKIKDFLYILSDPTEEQLGEMILKGERSMYPLLLFIKHRLTIERAIERGRQQCRQQQRKLHNTNHLHQNLQQQQQQSGVPFEISSATSRGTELYNDSQNGVQIFSMEGDDIFDDTDSTEDEHHTDTSQFQLGRFSEEDEDDADYLPSLEEEEDDDDDDDDENEDPGDDSGTQTDESIEDQQSSGFMSLFRRLSVDSNKLTRRNTIY